MGTIGGNLLQATRCWYWRLGLRLLAARRRPVLREGRRAPRARDLRQRALRVCASVRHRGRAGRARRDVAHDAARASGRGALPACRPTDDRDVTTLAPDELILELDVPQPEASIYLKAMDRRKWAFPIVGVAAARFGGEVRIALAGVAPIPWPLDSAAALEDATPLPGTAYKVEIARALVRRALAATRAHDRARHTANAPLLAHLTRLPLVLAVRGARGLRRRRQAERQEPRRARSTRQAGDVPAARPSRSRTRSTCRRTSARSTSGSTSKDSPCTTSSFAALVRKQFFDGTRFHRIVPGIRDPGRRPDGTGQGGPGYTVRDIPPANAPYTKGRRRDGEGRRPSRRDTPGSQFFVVTGDECRPTARLRDPRQSSRRACPSSSGSGELGNPANGEADAQGRRAPHARHAVTSRTMIAAVVLAAGASTRFGSPKQAVLLEPVLERVRASSRSTTSSSCSAPTTSRRTRAIRALPGLGARPRRVAPLRARRARRGRRGRGRRPRRTGPTLDPRAIDRVVDAWRARRRRARGRHLRRRPPPSACCSARAAWDDVPDEGLRASRPSSCPATTSTLQETSILPMTLKEGWPPRKAE